PRPLVHLVFVPAAPFLVGSADLGLVVCHDLQGKQIWRDALVANVGSVAVSGDGAAIVLACFSEGLRRFTLTGQNRGRLALGESCRLAALSFDGSRLLAGGLGNRFLLLGG